MWTKVKVKAGPVGERLTGSHTCVTHSRLVSAVGPPADATNIHYKGILYNLWADVLPPSSPGGPSARACQHDNIAAEGPTSSDPKRGPYTLTVSATVLGLNLRCGREGDRGEKGKRSREF